MPRMSSFILKKNFTYQLVLSAHEVNSDVFRKGGSKRGLKLLKAIQNLTHNIGHPVS